MSAWKVRSAELTHREFHRGGGGGLRARAHFATPRPCQCPKTAPTEGLDFRVVKTNRNLTIHQLRASTSQSVKCHPLSPRPSLFPFPYSHHCCAQLTLILSSSSPASATPFSRSTPSVSPCPRPVIRSAELVCNAEGRGGDRVPGPAAATCPLTPSTSASELLTTEPGWGRALDPPAGTLSSSSSDDERLVTESDSNSKLSDESTLSLPLESSRVSGSEPVSESYSGRADSGVGVVVLMVASSLWRQWREKARISLMKTEEVTRTTRMAAEMPTERC